jgi:broad specificity phosphatase PhoE
VKTIELRRNSIREAGKGLSDYGFQLARQAKPTLAPTYQLIVASPKRRCVETVETFGFHYFFTDPRLAPLDKAEFEPFKKEIKEQRETGRPWIEAAFAVSDCRPILKKLGRDAFKAVEAALAFMPEDGRGLVVTHGELLEAMALLAYPSYKFSQLGRSFGPCEGVELTYDGGSLEVREIRFCMTAETPAKIDAAPPEPAAVPQAEPAAV